MPGQRSKRVPKKSLNDYEVASRQPRPAPMGAHKRRPYEWLSESVSGTYRGPGRPNTFWTPSKRWFTRLSQRDCSEARNRPP